MPEQFSSPIKELVFLLCVFRSVVAELTWAAELPPPVVISVTHSFSLEELCAVHEVLQRVEAEPEVLAGV